MAAAKRLAAECWCPCCKTYHGKIYEKEVRHGYFEHVTEPKKLPLRCNVCEGVLVRK